MTAQSGGKTILSEGIVKPMPFCCGGSSSDQHNDAGARESCSLNQSAACSDSYPTRRPDFHTDRERYRIRLRGGGQLERHSAGNDFCQRFAVDCDGASLEHHHGGHCFRHGDESQSGRRHIERNVFRRFAARNSVSSTDARRSPSVRAEVFTSVIIFVSASTARSRATFGRDILMFEGTSAGWRYSKPSNLDARKFVPLPVSENPQIEVGFSPLFQIPSRVTTATSPRRGLLGIREPTSTTGVSSTCHLCNIKSASSELIFTVEPLPAAGDQ